MKYFLVLEPRPRDFMPLDFSILAKNNKIDYTNIQNIDAYTKNYTPEELLELVKKENIVPDFYLNGKFTIINENKYRFDVLWKDDNMLIDDFLKENINNKLIMNKLGNVYNKYSKIKNKEFKEAIVNKNINEALKILYMLDYEVIRNIYIYLLKM